jgi:hypothetical protein
MNSLLPGEVDEDVTVGVPGTEVEQDAVAGVTITPPDG